MKVLVTIGFIIIVLFSIFPKVMEYVLWILSGAFVIYLFIAAPRATTTYYKKKKKP